jgi:hypothetical protein
VKVEIMDQTGEPFSSEKADARQWIGRIIMAVILGEAIWGLIVSVMNNLVVPWLGDVMGQSSGLPTSFTQQPYDYPDLFVSIVELCIAGLVAAILNYFFQRPGTVRVKPVKVSVPIAPLELARVVPPAAPVAAPTQATFTQATSPVVPPAQVAKPDSITPPAAVPVAPSAPVANAVVAKPTPPAPKAEPPKPQKPKEVYYNIVGDPVPSDDN